MPAQTLTASRSARARRTGASLSYIEGWFAISGANRIFGFDGWTREPVNSRCVLACENRGSFLSIYVAKVTDQKCRTRLGDQNPTLAQWFWEIPSHEFFASATEN